jgi:hypothetical protein
MNARNRLFIQRALDSLQFVSDDQQHELNNLADAISLGIRSDGIGQVLRLSRTVDSIERVCSELQSLLDQPPRLGGAGSSRSLPGPERALDRAA